MKTAVYYRVSTEEQKTASQKPDVEKYLMAHDLQNARVFEDHFTGKSMNRPAWRDLEALIDAGKVGTLIIWRIDRLGRTAAGLTALFEKLIDKGVNLVSIRDSIDLSTASGKLIANVLASVAAYETEVRRERVAAGIKAEQRYICKNCDSILLGKNSKCPNCGSKQVVKLAETIEKWSGRVKGSLGKKTQEQLPVILELHKQGISQVHISKLTGISRATVNKVLKDRG